MNCPDRGCFGFVYYCPKYEQYPEISLDCNSRLCSGTPFNGQRRSRTRCLLTGCLRIIRMVFTYSHQRRAGLCHVTSRHGVSRYVARYVWHPAIVSSRICGYDGEEVTFLYVDRDYVRHYKTMSVDEFIGAIIQHVPERRLQFKMIRIRVLV